MIVKCCGCNKDIERKIGEINRTKNSYCSFKCIGDSKTNKKVGKRFGMLIIIGWHRRKKNTFYVCKCDCGNIKNIVSDSVTRKKGSVISCGCLQIKKARKDKGHHGLTNVFHAYKSSAKIRNIEFNLSKEQVKDLTQKNCYYCGREPSQIQIGYKSKKHEAIDHSSYIHNGIDRMDNTEGYIIENCVACCKRCNIAKNNLSKNDFFVLIKNIYQYCKLYDYKEE